MSTPNRLPHLNPDVPRPDELLTRKQVAERLSVSLEFVRDRLADGSLPRIKLGRNVRILTSDLLRYIESNRTLGGSR